MKKIIYTFLLLCVSIMTQAQDRYVDEMFDVEITRGVQYATNISIITGAPAAQNLIMDIYAPANDNITDRPVILIAPTGSFLPAFFNETTTGSLTDSTVVEVAQRLAKRGYVAAIFDYRKGWIPTATEESIRLSTLLQAAYRGIQDTRSAIRFMRKTVAEDGNLYNINPDNIGVWGVGTGGYLALGAGCLDQYSEVNLTKFIEVNNFDPVIDTTLLGNSFGTSAGSINMVNHPDYSDDISISVNMGGALGDTIWMEGKDNEPAFVGVHCTQDFFAPFFEGTVNVPGDPPQRVVDVAGTRRGIEYANALGNNDNINGISLADDPLKPLIATQKETDVVVQIAQGENVPVILGADNFYAFDIPIYLDANNMPVAEGSPWDWWDFDDLVAAVASSGAPRSPEDLHANSLRSNPNMSAERARLYIDTVFMLAIPRMYVSMNLGDAITDVNNITAFSVGLTASPNPASDVIRFSSDEDKPFSHLQVFDINGKLVSSETDLNTSDYSWRRQGLPSGVYVAKLLFKDGAATKKIIIE